jgi:Tfp pilus assembly protein PilF
MTGSDGDDSSLLRAAQRYRRAGLLTEAIGAYQKLLARRPDSPNSWYNLARLQRQAREYEAALGSYQRALDVGAESPEEIHLNRGVILSDDLHRHAQAEREFETALRLNPTYTAALFNLATLREDLGRREDAERTYERILALEPNNLQALARYAQTQPAAETSDALLQTLRSRLNDPHGENADRASVGFALGRALDGRGDYAAAFAAYTEANRLSRASAGARFIPYDRAAHERLIENIIGAFPTPSLGAQDTPPGPPAPVFICGMFRSGSTLIEQLLARHPRIGAAGELDWLPRIARETLAPYPSGAAAAPPQQLATLAAQYLGHLATVFPGAAQVTDKRPDNFLYIGLIKRLFPTAKIVHTTRDPLDNCLSIFFLHLDQSMSYALDLLDIGHYYRQCIRLMAHWKTQFPGDILDVHYDTLVREPQALMQRLLGFLGLEWDEHYLEQAPIERAVRTASVWQVRQSLYQSSSGRSRHYRAQLSKLHTYLNQGAPDRCRNTEAPRRPGNRATGLQIP